MLMLLPMTFHWSRQPWNLQQVCVNISSISILIETLNHIHRVFSDFSIAILNLVFIWTPSIIHQVSRFGFVGASSLCKDPPAFLFIYQEILGLTKRHDPSSAWGLPEALFQVGEACSNVISYPSDWHTNYHANQLSTYVCREHNCVERTIFKCITSCVYENSGNNHWKINKM